MGNSAVDFLTTNPLDSQSNFLYPDLVAKKPAIEPSILQSSVLHSSPQSAKKKKEEELLTTRPTLPTPKEEKYQIENSPLSAVQKIRLLIVITMFDLQMNNLHQNQELIELLSEKRKEVMATLHEMESKQKDAIEVAGVWENRAKVVEGAVAVGSIAGGIGLVASGQAWGIPLIIGGAMHFLPYATEYLGVPSKYNTIIGFAGAALSLAVGGYLAYSGQVAVNAVQTGFSMVSSALLQIGGTTAKYKEQGKRSEAEEIQADKGVRQTEYTINQEKILEIIRALFGPENKQAIRLISISSKIEQQLAEITAQAINKG